MEQTAIPDTPSTPAPHSPAPPEGILPSDGARRRRILFRATHRGTHETDILIGGFVQAGLAGFSGEELDALEEIMELPDVDLADWLTGRRPIPPESDSPMLRRIEDASHETARNARLGLVQR
ncbi:FAD assembly factor SdhE [Lichenicoccus roseus]|uniref:FAD assembly factor SdhE n=1 Tax=Lichenicoccus roseus TaxID=2683649 RepID=A0A5R9J4H4_9PROT|nr:succinate dehydrogenase assembly factor 2 [Lichenicoccus roseus]TLU72525.1 succinate dehydrogenase assembly factor 2 [Lichenicoccus roseus]